MKIVCGEVKWILISCSSLRFPGLPLIGSRANEHAYDWIAAAVTVMGMMRLRLFLRRLPPLFADGLTFFVSWSTRALMLVVLDGVCVISSSHSPPPPHSPDDAHSSNASRE